MLTNNQKRAVIDLAKAAGKKIMSIYAQDFDVDYKDDSSP
jgi:3'-phosphoadenosine 5'-phosphosulfate (PAPS) 3'-phosphatase